MQNSSKHVLGSSDNGTGEPGTLFDINILLMTITLTIMYKKGNKEKKNTKKVINSIGGKRPVQIIINASAQKILKNL
ncbi:hypothetical protein YYE_04747 [Plasmodium vinckei vinckei]|uniref:CIR protein PIR protein n=1 Tax=Plasmodium vinckei vinckei TaxID=54757 RepID=A0A081IA55_PLAVN|nr:hypothetical protein YYE_04747 [Plasmodium vinckei vinckei]